MRFSIRHAVSLAVTALCAGCTVGPDYVRPTVPTPGAWHPESPWTAANPQDGTLKGDWWTAFGDPELDQLEQKAGDANPTLKSAYEHYLQSVAQLGEVKSAEYPSIGVGAAASRARISANRPLLNYATPNTSTVQNDIQVGVQASYEVDLFGRVRREVEAAQAGTGQSAADYQNMRLVVAAEVATTYFSARQLDEEMDVVQSMVDYEGKALEFVQHRYQDGDASGLDLSQQQAQLDATRTQLELLKEQRAREQHALASLTGTPAPVFSLEKGTLPAQIPPVPVGVPSDLLQRRPDIAAAERAVAAANAKIGVARSAYYPNIVLSPSIAFESVAGGSLFTASSLLWSLGASAAQNVFEGGKIVAMNRFAEAGYRATVDDYSATVLKAFQEVQDGMSGLNYLGTASADATQATASADHVLSIATERYRDGLANYLDVIDAQQALLTQRLLATNIRGEQLAQCVYLIKALGGGWDGVGLNPPGSPLGNPAALAADAH
jgi:outer membrane protein, multidrug efflux system